MALEEARGLWRPVPGRPHRGSQRGEPASGSGHPAHGSTSLGLLRSRPDPVRTRPIAGDRTHSRARLSCKPTPPSRGAALKMAERGGFEPPKPLPTYTLSKRAPSATRTPLLCTVVSASPFCCCLSALLLEGTLAGGTGLTHGIGFWDSKPARQGWAGAGMAERGGFEPPVPVKTRWFSKPVHSAALAPLLVLRGVPGGNPWGPRKARVQPAE